MRRTALFWMLAAAVISMVAACGRSAKVEQASPPVRGADPPAAGSSVDPAMVCSRLTPPQPIPPEFQVTTVWQCSPEIRQLPGRGLWSVTVVQQADTAAPALVKALRAPSRSPSAGPCTAEAVTVAPVLLGDAQGRRIRPRIPTDSCGRPQQPVIQAMAELPFRTMAVVPRQPVRSQQR